jgi:Putative Actinobacterial Holin-X, holin superfamily III
MPAPSISVVRTGLALKLNQIRLAIRSYLRDRTEQAAGVVTSYAVAAGLFAATGVFFLAACLVGITALFRWVEINYGTFQAFGVVGVLLLAIAVICAALAASRLKRPLPPSPSLSSRLRVALKANPVKPDQIEAARDTAASILLAPSTPVMRASRRRLKTERRPLLDNGGTRASLILIATFLGWAAMRRRHTARQPET